MQARNERAIYLDVREPNEWNLGRLPHAIHLPRGNLETKVEGIIDRNQKVVIYCARGNRSALAALTMKQMGYENVASMAAAELETLPMSEARGILEHMTERVVHREC